MLTKEQRDEIRRRVDAATPGPWSGGDSRWDNVTSTIDEVEGARLAEVERAPDRHFIAAARTDVPALLDALDEMERAACALLNAIERAQAPDEFDALDACLSVAEGDPGDEEECAPDCLTRQPLPPGMLGAMCSCGAMERNAVARDRR